MKEALKLALDALTHVWSTTPDDDQMVDTAITAIKEALSAERVAQPAVSETHKQSTTCGEPVANVVLREGSPTLLRESDIKPTDERLYTTPPQQKPWVSLSEDQKAKFVTDIVELGTGFVIPLRAVVENIDAKLRELNEAPQRKPLTDEEIWKDDAIMAANSGYGATFETLRDIVRAIEAAHSIKGDT